MILDPHWTSTTESQRGLQGDLYQVHTRSTAVRSGLQRRNRAHLNDVVTEGKPIILLLGDVEMHKGDDLLSEVSVKAPQFSPWSIVT